MYPIINLCAHTKKSDWLERTCTFQTGHFVMFNPFQDEFVDYYLCDKVGTVLFH